MSGILPYQTIQSLQKYSDLVINTCGIDCTLYIPNNLTQLENKDAYLDLSQITYTEYLNQKVWIEWYAKDMYKLRKEGIFAEGELPIVARFKTSPEVIVGSYIVVPIRFIPESYKSNEFEVVDVVMLNTYSSEVLKRFKMAPRRKA